MKTIFLNNGERTFVDDNMFDFLNQWKWHKCGDYAKGRNFRVNGKRQHSWLHHVIVGRPLNNLEIDHIDGNSLNNCRENLRIVSTRENAHNRKEFRLKTKSSKYVGVSWHKLSNKWSAYISRGRKIKHLGLFSSEEQARDAYLNALEKINHE